MTRLAALILALALLGGCEPLGQDFIFPLRAQAPAAP